MDWKTWLKQRIEKYTGVRLYRWSLPRGVDFAYDARHILVPEKVQVVFDVGANIGQSADRYRLTYPNARILCFEPVSTTFQELNRRVATWRQVETYHLAFGSTAGPKSIHINSDPISSVNSFVNAFDGDLKEVVQVQTLDEFCLKNSIDNVDLLKIDVEGFELPVLQGAQRMLSEHRVKSLYLESTMRPNHDHYFVPFDEIDDHLAPLGYSIFGVYEQQMDPIRRRNYLYFFNVAYVEGGLCVS